MGGFSRVFFKHPGFDLNILLPVNQDPPPVYASRTSLPCLAFFRRASVASQYDSRDHPSDPHASSPHVATPPHPRDAG